jgi:hypothetical protein
MEGPELSLDAVVHRGRATVCGVADRHICFAPSFVEMGHTMPTDLDPRTVRRIEEIFTHGIAALGIDNGAAKGDIKLTAAGPMVGEIAARLSGGYMSGWTFPLASGVEVTAAALNVAMGLDPGDLTPSLRRTCAERALISVPGIVAAVEGESAARALPGVEGVFLRAAPGQAVVFPTNNVEKCGNVIAVADGREEAIRRAGAALSVLRIRLKPLEDRTTRYIFHQTGDDAFDALPASVAALPAWRGNPSQVAGGARVPVLVPRDVETATSRDWYGTRLRDAADAALEIGNGSPVGESGSGLGRIFWHALRRGGAQAGVYLLQSVRAAAAAGTLGEFLAGL